MAIRTIQVVFVNQADAEKLAAQLKEQGRWHILTPEGPMVDLEGRALAAPVSLSSVESTGTLYVEGAAVYNISTSWREEDEMK